MEHTHVHWYNSTCMFIYIELSIYVIILFFKFVCGTPSHLSVWYPMKVISTQYGTCHSGILAHHVFTTQALCLLYFIVLLMDTLSAPVTTLLQGYGILNTCIH